MNAKQEIHEILRRCVRYARPFTEGEQDKVRAILETHELVPVGTQEQRDVLLKQIAQGN